MDERRKTSIVSKLSEGAADYEIVGQCLVIRLITELDHHSSLEIKDIADRLIERHKIRYIVFDFKNSFFMDSAGIGVIMGRYKKVSFLGGKTVVTNVNPAIDRILKISGLDRIVERFKTVDDAIKSFQ